MSNYALKLNYRHFSWFYLQSIFQFRNHASRKFWRLSAPIETIRSTISGSLYSASLYSASLLSIALLSARKWPIIFPPSVLHVVIWSVFVADSLKFLITKMNRIDCVMIHLSIFMGYCLISQGLLSRRFKINNKSRFNIWTQASRLRESNAIKIDSALIVLSVFTLQYFSNFSLDKFIF